MNMVIVTKWKIIHQKEKKIRQVICMYNHNYLFLEIVNNVYVHISNVLFFCCIILWQDFKMEIFHNEKIVFYVLFSFSWCLKFRYFLFLFLVLVHTKLITWLIIKFAFFNSLNFVRLKNFDVYMSILTAVKNDFKTELLNYFHLFFLFLCEQ